MSIKQNYFLLILEIYLFFISQFKLVLHPICFFFLTIFTVFSFHMISSCNQILVTSIHNIKSFLI